METQRIQGQVQGQISGMDELAQAAKEEAALVRRDQNQRRRERIPNLVAHFMGEIIRATPKARTSPVKVADQARALVEEWIRVTLDCDEVSAIA